MTEHRPIVSACETRPQVVKLTVADFLLLERAGALRIYAKTELLDGVIVAMNSQHRPHAYAKSELAYRLRDAVRGVGLEIGVLVEGSVEIQPSSMPEPDITLTDAPRGAGFIPIDSVRLAVEVADTTFASDRRRKGAIYARAGIPEYWIVDLKGHRLIRMTQPTTSGYAIRADFVLGDPVASVTLPGLVVETDGLA